MPNRTLARIGLALAVAGAAVLAASLYDWAQTGPETEPQWVRADSSTAPAINKDERWQVAAACQRPYFVAATEQTRAKLKAYDDAGPEEIRAWHDRAQQRDKAEAESAESTDARALRAKYPDWFEAESKLERRLEQWQRRLDAVSDRTTTLSEARRRVSDIRLYVSDDPELASAGRDFQHFIYFLLGLGGFPDEQMNAIRAACIDVVAIKQIAAQPGYRTDIAHWPANRALTFWPGLALAFAGLVLSAAARRARA